MTNAMKLGSKQNAIPISSELSRCEYISLSWIFAVAVYLLLIVSLLTDSLDITVLDLNLYPHN